MLTDFPANALAWTTCAVWDITEPSPIPTGERVTVDDFDRAADLFIVQWQGRIYLAMPAELR